MTEKRPLDYSIIKKLTSELGITENTLRYNLSMLKRKYPDSNLNSLAQFYAESNGITVRKFLNIDEKKSIPRVNESVKIVKNLKKPVSINIKVKPKVLIKYETDDKFLKEHIAEANKAFNAHCYTCLFILSRKIIENIIIHILEEKFKSNKSEKKHLWYNKELRRYQDFKYLISNLKSIKDEFEEKNKAIESLVKLCDKLRELTNNAAHSLYFLKRKSDIEELKLSEIFELLNQITKFIKEK